MWAGAGTAAVGCSRSSRKVEGCVLIHLLCRRHMVLVDAHLPVAQPLLLRHKQPGPLALGVEGQLRLPAAPVRLLPKVNARSQQPAAGRSADLVRACMLRKSVPMIIAPQQLPVCIAAVNRLPCTEHAGRSRQDTQPLPACPCCLPPTRPTPAGCPALAASGAAACPPPGCQTRPGW